jgi:hypothetical protein
MFAAIGSAQEAKRDAQTPEVPTEKKFPPPSITDLTPLVAEIYGRKAVHEQEMSDKSNLKAVEQSFSKIANNIEESALELQQLKSAGEFRHRKFLGIKADIRSERDALGYAIEPITEDIRELDGSRKECLEKKKRWTQWQSIFLNEDPLLEEVKLILETAHVTIDGVLHLITEGLKPMLCVQREAGYPMLITGCL